MRPLRRSLPLVSGALALLFGFVPYALITWTGKIPAGLRDDPWPLELVAVLATAATLALLVVAFRQKRVRVTASISALLATLSTAFFLALVHVITYDLPPASAELAVGNPAPEFTLPDETGRPVTLASVHGHPTLLVFYRGFW